MNLLESVYQQFNRLALTIGIYLPFTSSYNLFQTLKGGGKTILDVGCGKGGAMASIKRHQRFITAGIDIHRPYLECARECHTHNHLVRGDVRHLPFKPKSFDSIICLEVIEHLDKAEGVKLLASMENIAILKTMLSMPIGQWEQHAYDGNPYQEHRSQWKPSELRALGYKVHVTGVRGTGGEWRGRSGFWRALDILWRLFSIVVAPLVTFFPQAAGNMVCSKDVSKSHQ
ncbi:MAG TPA: class I SAM-dependent methyltransferase [Dehalococcoidia bacterium]|nr:class I SAM-dependent methyltransferase [Dehalococcoidia bacterium]